MITEKHDHQHAPGPIKLALHAHGHVYSQNKSSRNGLDEEYRIVKQPSDNILCRGRT